MDSFFLVLGLILTNFLNTNGESTPIRINCGATSSETINGVTWEPDRNCMQNFPNLYFLCYV